MANNVPLPLAGVREDLRGHISGKANRFYLNQLEADFDVSLAEGVLCLTQNPLFSILR